MAMTMVSSDVKRGRSGQRGAEGDSGGTASVLKALKLLEVFRSGDSTLGVTEIARRVEVPTSTAYRLLAYLVEGGFVVKDGSKYRLGNRLFALGNQVPLCQPKGLREQVSPHLGELYAATGLTVKLGILEGLEVIILDKVAGLRTAPAPTAVGGRLPANCTSMGKALLAFGENSLLLDSSQLPRLTRYSINSRELLERQFDEIRASRLSYGSEEAMIGQVCVASPIIQEGRAVAAISLSARPNDPNLSRSIGALASAARQLERSLVL
ncbi:Acetate operon repressor [Corynebacterium occultum]|uniref:Glycerol operon regulatory protein n=2 Tax=Corynebacterium occultum TaxID=2675219 RepID=A0A6B8W3V7_9CORY|nr:Acetate operon repressor [Corynebacterium occultum]